MFVGVAVQNRFLSRQPPRRETPAAGIRRGSLYGPLRKGCDDASSDRQPKDCRARFFSRADSEAAERAAAPCLADSVGRGGASAWAERRRHRWHVAATGGS